MSPERKQISSEETDPLIDEVRAIRREICTELGNDVDRLVEHLRQVEVEYQERAGRFGGLLDKTSAEVVAGWGEDLVPTEDPVVDEVRAIRRDLADRR